ncbi:hypothetical protein XENTR_v10019065 [Xenopus tropicalis]|uniref:Urotensin-2 n=1 Tax=Xenopus tropicalis TaxID=8364 RepID=A0A803JKK6_XENTR|nr:urotensin-2 [Xenopus tropicalis]KAE8593288.1 hypothetical protein XENTR_v10019065 [Xenopus tropicalis]|eukprot:XP_002933899.1 PREDICTED: urotensin-2 [Xenopus tropicalis]
MTMQKLLLSLILASFTDPLLSLPLIDSREIPYQFPDGKMNFGELSSLDEDDLLHNLPAVLAKHNLIGDTDALLSKEELIDGNHNVGENIKEMLFGKHPRISLLSLLQSKDKKQYKKRGNLSECFWKYCV